jgi:predicted 3-demethylubiquinone-9 3-methyltransferase (glyoxalase superfamily)
MDRHGLRWQIVPAAMEDLMSGGDPEPVPTSRRRRNARPAGRSFLELDTGDDRVKDRERLR